MKRWTIIGLVTLMVLLIGFSTCVWAPPVYWATTIHGRVVDADSGEPLEGVVVVADWKLLSGGYGHSGHLDSLIVQETVTDTNGEFAFPEWGPTMRPSFTMLDKAPWLIVFKAAYDYQALWNELPSNAFTRQSEWSGKTLSLKRFSGSAEKRLDALDTLLSISGLQPTMLKEILADEPLHRSWPSRAEALFRHAKYLLDNPEKRKTLR